MHTPSLLPSFNIFGGKEKQNTGMPVVPNPKQVLNNIQIQNMRKNQPSVAYVPQGKGGIPTQQPSMGQQMPTGPLAQQPKGVGVGAFGGLQKTQNLPAQEIPQPTGQQGVPAKIPGESENDYFGRNIGEMMDQPGFFKQDGQQPKQYTREQELAIDESKDFLKKYMIDETQMQEIYNNVIQSDPNAPRNAPKEVLVTDALRTWNEQQNKDSLQGGVKGGLSRAGQKDEGPIMSALNYLNLPGMLTEKLDDWIQTNVGNVDVSEGADKRTRQKLAGLSDEYVAQKREKYNKSQSLKNTYGSFMSYMEQTEKSFGDTLLSDFKTVPNLILNIPQSALKTASATLRGATNPLDTMKGLYDIATTKEGHQALKDRYGSVENLKNTLESDPIGLASDLLTLVSGGASAVGKVSGIGSKMSSIGSKAQSTLSKVSAQANKIANIADVASDVGVRIPIDKLGGSAIGQSTVGRILLAPTKPLEEAIKIAGRVGDTMKNRPSKIQELKSGMERTDIKNLEKNPYQSETRAKAEEAIGNGTSLKESKNEQLVEVGEELKTKIDEIRDTKSEIGAAYEPLKQDKTQYNTQPAIDRIKQKLEEKRKIKENEDGSIDFGPRISRSATDKSMIQDTISILKNAGSMTAEDLLIQRKQLDNMARYDVAKTPEGRQAIRDARQALDSYMKETIPRLKDIDSNYADVIKEIDEATEGLVIRQGARAGEYRDNLINFIKNINNPAKATMRKRLLEIFPDLIDRVEAINNLDKIYNATTGSSAKAKLATSLGTAGTFAIAGSIIPGVGTAVGGLLGFALPHILDGVFAKMRGSAIKKILSKVTPEQTARLKEIESAYEKNKEVKLTDIEETRQIIAELKQKQTPLAKQEPLALPYRPVVIGKQGIQQKAIAPLQMKINKDIVEIGRADRPGSSKFDKEKIQQQLKQQEEKQMQEKKEIEKVQTQEQNKNLFEIAKRTGKKSEAMYNMAGKEENAARTFDLKKGDIVVDIDGGYHIIDKTGVAGDKYSKAVFPKNTQGEEIKGPFKEAYEMPKDPREEDVSIKAKTPEDQIFEMSDKAKSLLNDSLIYYGIDHNILKNMPEDIKKAIVDLTNRGMRGKMENTMSLMEDLGKKIDKRKKENGGIPEWMNISEQELKDIEQVEKSIQETIDGQDAVTAKIADEEPLAKTQETNTIDKTLSTNEGAMTDDGLYRYANKENINTDQIRGGTRYGEKDLIERYKNTDKNIKLGGSNIVKSPKNISKPYKVNTDDYEVGNDIPMMIKYGKKGAEGGYGQRDNFIKKILDKKEYDKVVDIVFEKDEAQLLKTIKKTLPKEQYDMIKSQPEYNQKTMTIDYLMSKKLKVMGYDGIELLEKGRKREVMVFDPKKTKILSKPTTPVSKDLSPKNPETQKLYEEAKNHDRFQNYYDRYSIFGFDSKGKSKDELREIRESVQKEQNNIYKKIVDVGVVKKKDLYNKEGLSPTEYKSQKTSQNIDALESSINIDLERKSSIKKVNSKMIEDTIKEGEKNDVIYLGKQEGEKTYYRVVSKNKTNDINDLVGGVVVDEKSIFDSYRLDGDFDYTNFYPKKEAKVVFTYDNIKDAKKRKDIFASTIDGEIIKIRATEAYIVENKFKGGLEPTVQFLVNPYSIKKVERVGGDNKLRKIREEANQK